MIDTDSEYLPNKSQVIDLSEKKAAWLELSLMPAISAYVIEPGEDKSSRTAEINDFAVSQFNLIEREIKNAMSRKKPYERERTQTLKNYLSIYGSFIKNIADK